MGLRPYTSLLPGNAATPHSAAPARRDYRGRKPLFNRMRFGSFPGVTDIFDDLEAEYEQLDNVLAGLTQAQWAHPSAAAGWSVADVVLHLAQTEEAVAAS